MRQELQKRNIPSPLAAEADVTASSPEVVKHILMSLSPTAQQALGVRLINTQGAPEGSTGAGAGIDADHAVVATARI